VKKPGSSVYLRTGVCLSSKVRASHFTANLKPDKLHAHCYSTGIDSLDRGRKPSLRKVLHITTDFLPGSGGMERFIRDLVLHSRTIDIDPSVLALNKIAGDDRILPPLESLDGISIRRIPFLDLKYYKPSTLPIELLKSADILHVHGIGAPLDFVAATKSIHRRPIVLSTHGGIFHTAKLSLLKDWYFDFVKKFVLPRVDRIVACGQADRQLFTDRGVSNLIAIDNGIDLAPFAGDDSQRIANRLLFVGRIAPNKSVDHLLRSLAELHRNGTPATLRIIGPDRNRLVAGLKQLVVDLALNDSVSFAGEVTDRDLPIEYHQADLFVSASRHEGFGISAVEAMAAGAIPLLNDIPAFGYLLKNESNAQIGGLTDFSEAKQSALALQRLLSSDRVPLRAAARARAADFSWNQLIPRWRELYDSLSYSKT
jgi:alpha-1,3-mannosyltransferase